jgi:hypothetical protein
MLPVRKTALICIVCLLVIIVLAAVLILLNKFGILLHVTNNIVWFYQQNVFTTFVILLNLSIMILFASLGYKMALRKNRSPVYWSALCFLFHVWAYLVLYFLDAQKSLSTKDKQ